jgi:MerR, DNA binding
MHRDHLAPGSFQLPQHDPRLGSSGRSVVVTPRRRETGRPRTAQFAPWAVYIPVLRCWPSPSWQPLRASARPRSATTSRSGCCPPPARVAGQRRYHHHTVRTLAVIDTGQRAGLALDEIKLLLSASPDDGEAIDRLREVADRKLPQITALIERSQLVRH